MKAGVLYSGGKDSSLMAILLKKMGIDVELITVNFGVYDSYFSALNSAKSLNLDHKIFKMDKAILEKTISIIIDDGFPNNGIDYLHSAVLDEIASNYSIIADGIRRDDRTPKLNQNQIRSLEDRMNVQYVNLSGFGHKTIDFLVKKSFIIEYEKSNKDNSSDYEVEIRCLIDEERGKSQDFFPEHYQSRVIGLKK